MNFLDKIKSKWDQQKFLCINLDQSDSSSNQKIIDDTRQLVCAYKLNSAFYEAAGLEGRQSLEKTIAYLIKNHPDIPIILDAKRSDTANTDKEYARDAFDNLKVDGLTINPYPGRDALQPFLDFTDKAIFVWVKSSNPGSSEFQDLLVGKSEEPLYQVITKHVVDWNSNKNCGLVVGATYPEQLQNIRRIAPNLPILVPGIGVQGGDLKATVKNGLDAMGGGLIIAVGRSIIFANNPKQAALDLHQQIVSFLKELKV